MKSYYTFILSALLVFTACDPLGIDPTTEVFEDQFWKNTQLARSYVYKFYTWSPAGVNHYFQAEQWSDNAIGNDDRDQDVFRQTGFTHRQYDALTGVPGFSVPWGGHYQRIRAVNLGLERIPNVPNILENDMNQLLAECYFFRGLTYFDLEIYWGGVPYIDQTMTIFDETMLPRIGREELYDKILEDFDEAIRLMKLSGNTPTLGLANIDAIETYKSRVALYAACAADASKVGTYDKLSGSNESKALFKFQKDSKYYYEIAYNAAKNVYGKYELEPNYKDLFNTLSGHKSKEAIWPVMFNRTNRSGFNPALYCGPRFRYYGTSADWDKSWGMTGAAFPTQDLVDCYYQKDKADGKWKQWWKTQQFREDMNGTVDANGYIKATTENYRTMYTDRDERFYTTILYDGAYYAGIEKELYLFQMWIDNSDPVKSEKYSALHTGFRFSEKLNMPNGGYASQNSITGYYPTKYVPGQFNEDGTVNKDTQTDMSYFMVRYAEVLLNYAEAAIKLNKESEAIPLINEIRNRAGLDDFDAAVVGHGVWEEYQLQRRVEFAYEVPGHRYFDLTRWGESEGKTTIEELNRGPKVMFIFRKGIESEVIGINGYPAPKDDPKYFTPMIETGRVSFERYAKKFNEATYYKIPFSQTTLTSNKALIQNPGWDGKAYQ